MIMVVARRPAATATTTPVTTVITPLETETLQIPIIGTAPLIVHNFSDKAKRQMLDNMQGKKAPKQPRDPQADYEAAFYRTENGYGFPVIGFKAATVGAARFYGTSVKMTELRQFIFMRGQLNTKFDQQALVEITGEPEMREDVVRINNGKGTDLRYRPMFSEWSTTLDVIYISSALSRDSVISLIDAGGMGIGIGEWRPEKRGDFGTYRVDLAREIKVLPK